MITHLYRYPVKGLSAEALQDISLTVENGLAGDRAIAIARQSDVFDPAAPKAVSKFHFLMLAKDEALAKLRTAYDEETSCLTLSQDGDIKLTAPVNTAHGRQAIIAFLSDYLGDPSLNPDIVFAAGHKFTDISVVSPQKMRAISIINLNSVRALEDAIGAPVDPLRFRGNVYIDRVPAWAEFDWIDGKISLGDAEALCVMRTRRCPATQVNPETGTRDLNIPAELVKHFGHFEMGIYAEITSDGRAAVGQDVRPLEAR